MLKPTPAKFVSEGVSAMSANPLRKIPSIHELLENQTLKTLAERLALPPASRVLERLAALEPSHGRALLEEVLSGGVAYHNADLPWALRVARIAARRNGVVLETALADLATDSVERPDIILAADVEYDSSSASMRERLDGLVTLGSTLLVADAGRSHFKPDGLELVASFARRSVTRRSKPASRSTAFRQDSQLSRAFPCEARVYSRLPEA